MNRGDIRWYRFSNPDKRRPVLVLTRDSAIPYLGEVTVALITTTIRDIPTEVELAREEGMPQRCVVNCDRIQTVSKAKVGASIAKLPPERWLEIERALSFALGFRT